MTTGRLVRSFPRHSSKVKSVKFSPDGKSALSGSEDKTLKLWDLATGNLLRSFEGHAHKVGSVAFSPDGSRVLSGAWDKTLKLWETATGKLLHTFEGHSGEVVSVAYSPDGSRALSGSWDNTLKLWDVATGTLLRTFEGHAKPVPVVAFSPDGTRALSGSRDKTLKLWEVATGKLLRTFTGHTDAVVSAAFSPDGSRVVSAGYDGTPKLWDAATGKLLPGGFQGRTTLILSVAFAPDGGNVVSAGRDGTVRLWALDTGREAMRLLAGSGGDWLALTPAGFFDFKGNVDKFVHLVHGLEVLSVDQTFEQLYRPDLVEAVLKGDPEGHHKNAAHHLNLDAVLATGSAPQIEYLGKQTERAGDTIKLAVRIVGAGGGIGKRVVWKVNGVTQGNTTPPALAGLDDPLAWAVVTETLKLVPDEVNLVEVTTYNRAGLVATRPLKITVDKFGVTTRERPRMFVLALGVDAYRMEQYRLKYAAHDARAFAKALERVGSALFPQVKTTVLTDTQVSEAGIASAIDKIAQEASPQDVFVLFLGGHGKTIAGRYYYYPQTLDFAAKQTVEQHGIGQSKWEAWLPKIAVQKSLLVIDTCEGHGFRGTDSVLQTSMAQLERAVGRNIIAASREGAAYEGYRSHGVLTYALLEGLDIRVVPGDGLVGISSLADHAERRVPEISSKEFGVVQLPARRFTGNIFDIGKRQSILDNLDDKVISK
jgi:hypothetical protein